MEQSSKSELLIEKKNPGKKQQQDKNYMKEPTSQGCSCFGLFSSSSHDSKPKASTSSKHTTTTKPKESVVAKPKIEDLRASGGKLPLGVKFKISDFALKKEVGKGTFGQVYLAEYQGYKYAIKTVMKEFIINVRVSSFILFFRLAKAMQFSEKKTS